MPGYSKLQKQIDYEAGFKQGWQLCCGTSIRQPVCPLAPNTHRKQNYFNDGLRLGIKYGANAGCNCKEDY